MTERTASSLAFFGMRQARLLSACTRLARQYLGAGSVIVISEPEAGRRATSKVPAWITISSEAVGFQRVPISFAKVQESVLEHIDAAPRDAVVVVDMGWGLQTASATANFEGWMPIAAEIAARSGLSVISLYNRRLLIDQHLLAALRGHSAILTDEGVVPNPHWLPHAILSHGTLREQVDYWLGGLSASLAFNNPVADRHAAEGTDPMWLLNRRAAEPTIRAEAGGERWKIRCFGRLRVYLNDGSQVQWGVSGGATMKTKTLFAYLLQQGGKGARADDLADLLWPEAESVEAAKNRLYHTIRCLRRALSPEGKGNGESGVLRDGAHYVLVPPERSWLDISTFEQLCRQSQGHIKSGDSDEALVCLAAADRLYTGDLFEDIPSEYVDDGERDWCWTRRYWLRDMYLKVQRDAARIYRQRADYTAALGHCQKALAIDPLSEFAHEEAMHVFAAQNRHEAVDRQYALYLDSLARFDDRPRSEELTKVYRTIRG